MREFNYKSQTISWIGNLSLTMNSSEWQKKRTKKGRKKVKILELKFDVERFVAFER